MSNFSRMLLLSKLVVLLTDWALAYTYQKPKGLHDAVQRTVILSSVTVF